MPYAIVFIVLIVCCMIYAIVKMGIQYSENVERIKHGYPLADGSKKKEEPKDYIDVRDRN